MSNIHLTGCVPLSDKLDPKFFKLADGNTLMLPPGGPEPVILTPFDGEMTYPVTIWGTATAKDGKIVSFRIEKDYLVANSPASPAGHPETFFEIGNVEHSTVFVPASAVVAPASGEAPSDDGFSQSGRTTRLIRSAHLGAAFVCLNPKHTRSLAQKLGRHDLFLVSASWLLGDNWRGTYRQIVVDHAVWEHVTPDQRIKMLENLESHSQSSVTSTSPV